MNKHIERIQRSSKLGLWSSVALAIASGLFVWISPWQFRQNATVANGMLIAGAILAVGAVSMALLVIRKRIPQLRLTDNLDPKLQGYADHIHHLYSSLAIVVAALCAMTVLSGQSTLLMLTLVTTLMLVLAYPNMYKIKSDLGLSGDEMRQLFGDKYLDNDAQ